MASDEEQRLIELSRAVTELRPSERPAFLDRTCAGDPELRRKLESVIAAEDLPTEIFEGESGGNDEESYVAAGQRVGKYRILRKLGEGGMGTVFVAEDPELGRQVALKLLSDQMALDSEHLQRFRREARALAALNHANIVTIFSVESDEDLHFLTMEKVEGEALDELIPPGGMALGELLSVAVSIAEALAAAHAKGVTHRDLKPANVMLSKSGEVKVLDFGLAKLLAERDAPEGSLPAATLTRTGMVMGTVPYMSPEQVEGRPVDHRTDVFSLGVVLYEMAAGERPFQGESAAGLMSSILKDSPPPLSRARPRLPKRLGQIIERCLEKDPEQRYQDAESLARDLRQLREAVVQHPTVVTSLGTLSALIPRTRRWRIAVGSLIVAILALGGVALNFDNLSGRLAAPTSNPEIESLAVLPFANLSGDEEQDYLAGGMTEMLTTQLSRISDLRVISRSSVMRFAGTDRPVADIAKELGVEAAVAGSVLRSADQVRVTAQLVHAESEFQLWADSFERSLQDILILQGEVAQAIAHQVQVTLTPQALARLEGLGAVSPQAAELYFKGLTANIWTKESMFQAAIAEEPGFAQAHAALANTFALLGWMGWPYSPEKAFGSARESAAQALEIDPDLAEGHAVQGWVALHFDWNWDAAETAFRRAMELDPGNIRARHGLSFYLAAMGRFEEAIAEAEKARELDPLSLDSHIVVCQMLYFARQLDRGLDELHNRFEAEDPQVHRMRWQLLNAVGDLEAAAGARLLSESLSGTPKPQVEVWNTALTEGGAEGFWRSLIHADKTITPEELFHAVQIAEAYVQIGELDEALAALETGFDRRRPRMAYLGADPMWDPLRADPRFNDLLIRLNLPQAVDSEG